MKKTKRPNILWIMLLTEDVRLCNTRSAGVASAWGRTKRINTAKGTMAATIRVGSAHAGSTIRKALDIDFRLKLPVEG